MELENQVVSLELAKQLKELGVKQDSYFWYTLPEGKYVQKFMELNPAYEDDENAPTKVQLTAQPDFYGIYGEPVTKVSAFTVAELFDYLYTEKGELWVYHNAGMYLVQGFNSEANEENLADCLAKILIANL